MGELNGLCNFGRRHHDRGIPMCMQIYICQQLCHASKGFLEEKCNLCVLESSF